MSRQIIWAAGFFDGEGCISIGKAQPQLKYYKHNHHYTVRLTVYQNIRAPLQIFKELFGGTIKLRPATGKQKNNGWVWSIGGRGLVAALTQMLPYLIVKKEQAELAIGFQGRKVPRGQKYADGKNARLLDDADYQRMRELKVVAK
jgi:hypothetical protein